ncbi:MAG TPA: hypothetical protein VFQ35_28555, partial [Polyangiaceae bacterium]|nr:hypothetical protein [Polyangiaceae bacterium]
MDNWVEFGRVLLAVFGADVRERRDAMTSLKRESSLGFTATVAFAVSAALIAVGCGGHESKERTEVAVATKVEALSVPPPATCTDHTWNLLTTGLTSACVDGPGGFKCWGLWSILDPVTTQTTANFVFPPTNPTMNVGGSTRIRAAASGYRHTCVAADNGVWCFGDNAGGQLGNGTQVGSQTPVRVNADFGDRVVSLSSKAMHTCALLNNGEVWCWGENSSFACGVAPASAALTTPGKVDLGGRTAKAIATGSGFSCALSDAGEVLCWGSNASGKAGVPGAATLATPTLLDTSGKRAVLLSAGLEHGCAVFDDQTSACWGLNQYGTLATGDRISKPSPTPVNLNSPAGAPIQLDAGARHQCAVYQDGSLRCWGKNVCWDMSGNSNPNSAGGQLGLGVADSDWRLTPQSVPLGSRKV